MKTYSTKRASDFIDSIDKETVDKYRRYWRAIRPKTHRETYLRYIFSFMSVHTTWKANVKGFLAVKALGEEFTKEQLLKAIVDSRTGIIKRRSQGIWDFHNKFHNNPKFWHKREKEKLREFRNRIENELYGLGLAKTSFVIEMCHPENRNVTCLDTHMLQLYSIDRKLIANKKLYDEIECHWSESCSKRKIPNAIARHIYWDGIQKKTDTRYWSYVLES